MNKKIIIHITLFIIIQVLINMLIFIAFIPFVKADIVIYIDQQQNDASHGMYYYSRVGEKVIVEDKRITICSFLLFRQGNPTGTLYSRIRKLNDDIIETSTDTLDVSTILTSTTWYNFTFDSYIDEEVRFTVECVGNMDSDNTIWVRGYLDDVLENIDFTRYHLSWEDLPQYECAIRIWEETAPPDDVPVYSSVGDDGVTQVGESVTVYSYWEDDFELDICYIEHNATETPTNYSISVSGSSSWANKTFQLAFTKNVKVAYKFWCSDNASQWNSTSYSYITTTQLYITFNLNNSTQGRFYVDLVNTANNTVNGYDYNETVFLLGATYNYNYSWCNFTYSETVIEENFYDFQTSGNETVWCNFDVCNMTSENGNGEYTETDLHEYFVLGVIISAVCVSISLVIIIDKKDLIRGK